MEPAGNPTGGNLTDYSLDSVTRGGIVDLDARTGGPISKAIEAGKRDFIAVLSKRLPVKRYLRWELPLICQWVRLAIRYGQHDIFRDLLERHSDVVKCGADVNYPLLFASMVYWGDDRPDDFFLAIVFEWLEGLDIQLRALWKLKRFNVGRRRHPLYLAFQRNRFDLVDAFFALGASLQDRPSGRLSVLQIIFSELDRNDIWRLIERGLSIQPTDVISMTDVMSILLNWNHQRALRKPEDVEPEMLGGDYRGLVRWTKSRRSRRLLRWKRPFYEENTKLWANISKASTCQERRVQFSEQETKHSNLVLHAVLQSNWAAVRCLLDMGFSPDGTGSYWYSTAHHLYQLPLKPLDVASWTTCIHDAVCTESGLRLKRSNHAIATLLRERGASHSGAYSLSNLLALPFLETWEYLCAEFNEVTHHHSRIGLFFSVAGFLVGIFSLWLLWYLAGLVSDFTEVGVVLYLLFCLLAVPNILLFCWAICWLPMKVIFKGHRKLAYARLVHGESLVAFWTSAIGQGNAVCRLLGRCMSGWVASEVGDDERGGRGDDEFGQRLVEEYESIVKATVGDMSTMRGKEGEGGEEASGLKSHETDSVGRIIHLFIRGKLFKFTVGSHDTLGAGQASSSRRPRVRFETGESSSPEGEMTPLLVAHPWSIDSQEHLPRRHTSGVLPPGLDEYQRPALQVVASWDSGGYGTLGFEDGPRGPSSDAGSFVPRSMDPGDAMLQDTPSWGGHEWQWRMFLMSSNSQAGR